MADTLIHMTAQYSNAVLVAVLPHFSDFAAKLDLSVPQPITISQVATSKFIPFTNHLGVAVWLTNGYWFVFHSHRDPQHGLVTAFSGPKDWFHDQVYRDEEVSKYFGVSHMTTNKAVAMARATLLKIGWEPRITHADLPPTRVDGPADIKRLNGHIPYCQVNWEWPPEGTPHLAKNHTSIVVRINTETKKVVGIESAFGIDNPPPTVFVKPSVEPELEVDFQKRTRQKIFTDTNAPARKP